MTTALDTQIVPKVLEVIDTYGINLTYTTVTASYDADTGEVSEVEATVVRKTSPPQGISSRMVDGDTHRIGDLVALVAGSGLSFDPVALVASNNLRVAVGGENYIVYQVQPIRSGDEVAAYKLFMRRA